MDNTEIWLNLLTDDHCLSYIKKIGKRNTNVEGKDVAEFLNCLVQSQGSRPLTACSVWQLDLQNIKKRKSQCPPSLQRSEFLVALKASARWSWVRSRTRDAGKGYKMNKVEYEGQTCPSHLKMDVSLPDEPFLEMTL